jgi:surface protein
MDYMFYNAQNFNGDLSNWNTANVNNNAYRMFYGATAWLNNHVWVYDSNADHQSYNGDGPPDRWCGSNCAFPADGSALKEAVASCLNANPDGNCDCSQSWINCRHGLSQPMSEWDVSRVTNMYELFSDQRHDSYSMSNIYTQNFNADISRWNTHSVTDMNSMFQNAHNFNADISRWNTASVTSMSYMFQNAHNFNADISNWNTQSLAHMEKMFENAHSFDADITKWTCDAYESQRTRSQVEDMFKGADAWHASYVNTHAGYFDRDLGPPNMWMPNGAYKKESTKDKVYIGGMVPEAREATVHCEHAR